MTTPLYPDQRPPAKSRAGMLCIVAACVAVLIGGGVMIATMDDVPPSMPTSVPVPAAATPADFSYSKTYDRFENKTVVQLELRWDSYTLDIVGAADGTDGKYDVVYFRQADGDSDIPLIVDGVRQPPKGRAAFLVQQMADGNVVEARVSGREVVLSQTQMDAVRKFAEEIAK